jgi:hypothetical protein
MTTLVLHGEYGRRLTIDVHGYERDSFQDPYDANWLRCSVDLDAGRFRGAVDASFTTQDFARFLSEMDQVVRGDARAASFQTMEEALSIRVEVDRAGRALVTGSLREIDAGGSVLSYSIESDLSFLQRSHAELTRIVEEFPERGVSNS